MRYLKTLLHCTKHIFLTGKAGTGKSTLIGEFISQTDKNIAILAPTGVAAINIGGETIHSFFCFKPDVTEKDALKLGKSKKGDKFFTSLEVIVIDEVSMLRADLLDFIDLFLRNARDNQSECFGGIKMIFVGDLFQLPPIVNRDEINYFRQTYRSVYFFSSNVFKEIMNNEALEYISLKKIFRQKDRNFKKLLSLVRSNENRENLLHELNQRVINPSSISHNNCNNDPIYLVSTNLLADEKNTSSLQNLKGKEYVFKAEVSGSLTEKEYPTSLNLTIKIGAKIMLLNNDQEKRWHNGSIGKITDFDEKNNLLEVTLEDDSVVYVSRITWTKYRSIFDQEKNKVERVSAGSFTQFPLKLAWAVTIHKSQGKTFDKVIIDLGHHGAFAHGQLYVALSRCRTLKGIQLIQPVKPKDLIVDPFVVKFTSYLEKSTLIKQ